MPSLSTSLMRDSRARVVPTKRSSVVNKLVGLCAVITIAAIWSMVTMSMAMVAMSMMPPFAPLASEDYHHKRQSFVDKVKAAQTSSSSHTIAEVKDDDRQKLATIAGVKDDNHQKRQSIVDKLKAAQTSSSHTIAEVNKDDDRQKLATIAGGKDDDHQKRQSIVDKLKAAQTSSSHTIAEVNKDDDRQKLATIAGVKDDNKQGLLTPFVILTAPRSGSEFVMASIDRHPLICATGEVPMPGEVRRIGWPREALMPPQLVTDYRIKFMAEGYGGKMPCNAGPLTRMLTKHMQYANEMGSAALLEHCNTVYTKLWEDQVNATAQSTLRSYNTSRFNMLLKKNESSSSSSSIDIKDLIMLIPREFLNTFTSNGISSMLDLEYTSCDVLRLSEKQMKEQYGHLTADSYYNNRTARQQYADVAFSLYLDFAYRGGNMGGHGIGSNERKLGGRMFGDQLEQLRRTLRYAQREKDDEKRSRLIDEALASVATPPPLPLLPHDDASPKETAEAVGTCIPCRCAPRSRAIGFKLMHAWYRDYQGWLKKNDAEPEDYYADILPYLAKSHPDFKVVVLDRENILKLTVSLHRAKHNMATNMDKGLDMSLKELNNAFQWHDGEKVSTGGVVPQVTVDKTKFPLDVAKAVKFMQREVNLRSVRDRTLEDLGVPILRLRYEDCAKDPNTCVDAVAQFLGIPRMDLVGGERKKDAAKSAEKEKERLESSKEGASAKVNKSILDEIANPDELLDAVETHNWTHWLAA
ncbi:hypothetical protein NFJ02_06g129100 [Pycnococcus provasolii]